MFQEIKTMSDMAWHGMGEPMDCTNGRCIRQSILRSLSLRSLHHPNTVRPSKHLIEPLLPDTAGPLELLSAAVFCGTFSKDGQYFLAASQDGLLRVHSFRHGLLKLLYTINGRIVRWSILDTEMSPDSRWVVYSSWGENLHMFSNVEGNETHKALPICSLDERLYRFCAFSLSFSADTREIIAGCNGGAIYIYDLYRNETVGKIQDAHEADTNAVSFAGGSNHVVYSASDDGILKVWDRRILDESHPLPVSVFVGHGHGITYLDSKGDFRYIITNSKDQTIKLWDTRHPSSQSDIPSVIETVKSNSTSWDYRNYDRRMMNLRDQQKDDSVKTYSGHLVNRTLIRARFSPEFSTGQKYIYTGSGDGNVLVYDVLSGEKVYPQPQGGGVDYVWNHKSVVRDVSWHPYEPFILSSSFDNTIGCVTMERFQSVFLSNNFDIILDEGDDDDYSS